MPDEKSKGKGEEYRLGRSSIPDRKEKDRGQGDTFEKLTESTILKRQLTQP